MGKKRQRDAAPGGESTKLAAQTPSQLPAQNAAETSKKKHKKAPLQLKMIVMKGATTANANKQKETPTAPTPLPKPSPTHANAPAVLSTKTKKKKKNKTNKKINDTTLATETPTKPSTADIDDLFQSLRTKKHENALAAEREIAEAVRAKKLARQERERLDEQIKLLEAQNTNLTAVQGKNPEARPLRYDEDGLPIYSEEALQINQGGDTADCPFDCWCCF